MLCNDGGRLDYSMLAKCSLLFFMTIVSSLDRRGAFRLACRWLDGGAAWRIPPPLPMLADPPRLGAGGGWMGPLGLGPEFGAGLGTPLAGFGGGGPIGPVVDGF